MQVFLCKFIQKEGKFYIVMNYYSRPLWSFFILERSFDEGMGNNKVVYQVRCPECGEMKKVELSVEEYENLQRYYAGEGLIQDMLPDIEPPIRELLRGGMCGECWIGMFGVPPWEDSEKEEHTAN